jgi:plastocyanin
MSKNRVGFLGAMAASFLVLSAGGRARAADANVTIESPYSFRDSVSATGTTTINAGDTVTWHWSSSNHSTTSGTCSGGYYGECVPDGTWDSGLNNSGTVFSHTFPAAGTFKYYCSYHGSMMTGKVIVNAIVPPPPPPPPPPPTVVTCAADAVTLCIDDVPGDNRFKVQVHWQTSQGGGQSGDGQAIPLSNLGVTEGGLFWFFSANNPELLIKIVNGCPVTQHWWVFASAGTNVGITITITDTSDQSVKVYTNPDRTAMAPIQDTAAFSNCQ